MPRRGNRSRGRGRGRRIRNRPSQRITQYFTFSIAAGSMQVIYAPTLKVPSEFNYRPLVFSADVMYYRLAQAEGSSSTPILPSAPVGACQLQMYDTSGERCTTSRPIMIGTNPRRVSTRYPISAGWFGASTSNSKTTPICVINSICLGSQLNANTFMRGVGKITYALNPELLIGSCPSYNQELDHEISWAQEVENQIPLAASTQRFWPTDNDRALTSACSVDSVAIDLSFLDL